MPAIIEKYFPRLIELGYVVTSPVTRAYNCIAFTLGDMQRWWWPQVYGDQLQSYWPENAPAQESLDAFIEMYKLHGFDICQGVDWEPGYVKIVVLVDDKEGLPAHAALQLSNGKWVSKMWEQEDIMHEITALLGPPVHFEIGIVLRCATEKIPTAVAALLKKYGSPLD